MDVPDKSEPAIVGPEPGIDELVRAAWRANRAYLLDLAYRMLSDIGAAEDVVQEAFLRFASGKPAQIREPRGWLTVVCARLCLDHLRSAWARRERPREPPDLEALGPVANASVDPADRITLDDQVRLALLSVLERLGPDERVALVLHDVFAVPYEEIAQSLGKSAAACRQLASRARQKVTSSSSTTRRDVQSRLLRDVTQAFLAACANSDLETLTTVLHPEVWGAADLLGPPGVAVPHSSSQVQHGRTAVAGTLMRFFGGDRVSMVTVPAAGSDSVILAFAHRRPYAVVTLNVVGDLVVKVSVTADPLVSRPLPTSGEDDR